MTFASCLLGWQIVNIRLRLDTRLDMCRRLIRESSERKSRKISWRSLRQFGLSRLETWSLASTQMSLVSIEPESKDFLSPWWQGEYPAHDDERRSFCCFFFSRHYYGAASGMLRITTIRRAEEDKREDKQTIENVMWWENMNEQG